MSSNPRERLFFCLQQAQENFIESVKQQRQRDNATFQEKRKLHLDERCRLDRLQRETVAQMDTAARVIERGKAEAQEALLNTVYSNSPFPKMNAFPVALIQAPVTQDPSDRDNSMKIDQISASMLANGFSVNRKLFPPDGHTVDSELFVREIFPTAQAAIVVVTNSLLALLVSTRSGQELSSLLFALQAAYGENLFYVYLSPTCAPPWKHVPPHSPASDVDQTHLREPLQIMQLLQGILAYKHAQRIFELRALHAARLAALLARPHTAQLDALVGALSQMRVELTALLSELDMPAWRHVSMQALPASIRAELQLMMEVQHYADATMASPSGRVDVSRIRSSLVDYACALCSDADERNEERSLVLQALAGCATLDALRAAFGAYCQARSERKRQLAAALTQAADGEAQALQSCVSDARRQSADAMASFAACVQHLSIEANLADRDLQVLRQTAAAIKVAIEEADKECRKFDFEAKPVRVLLGRVAPALPVTHVLHVHIEEDYARFTPARQAELLASLHAILQLLPGTLTITSTVNLQNRPRVVFQIQGGEAVVQCIYNRALQEATRRQLRGLEVVELLVGDPAFHPDRLARLMNPKFDKKYDMVYQGPQSPVRDKVRRGPGKFGVYRFPLGWERFGLLIDNFDRRFDGWHVCYHGSADMNCAAILETGVRPSRVSQYQGPNEVVVCATPSVIYAANPRFARVFFRQNPDGSISYYQMVFQCRIRPGAFEVRPASVPVHPGRRIDPHYENAEVEFVLRHPAPAPGQPIDIFRQDFANNIVCYGVLVRQLDQHPSTLPESAWWVRE